MENKFLKMNSQESNAQPGISCVIYIICATEVASEVATKAVQNMITTTEISSNEDVQEDTIFAVLFPWSHLGVCPRREHLFSTIWY